MTKHHTVFATSRPARGAWIETDGVGTCDYGIQSRAPHGARGLKPGKRRESEVSCRRAPHGARGLKRHEGVT